LIGYGYGYGYKYRKCPTFSIGYEDGYEDVHIPVIILVPVLTEIPTLTGMDMDIENLRLFQLSMVMGMRMYISRYNTRLRYISISFKLLKYSQLIK